MNYQSLNNLTIQYNRIKADMECRYIKHHNTWSLWGSLYDMSDYYKDLIDIQYVDEEC